MLSQEQIDLHRTHIGGSMAPAVVGVSSRMSRRELYEIMAGNLPEPEFPEELALLGHGVEPIASAWYERNTGTKLQRSNVTHHHREHPWMMAHIDRRAVGERRGLEIKMRQHADGWGPPGTDDVPDEIIVQCQHYMGVMGPDWPVWDVVVLLHGIEFRRYEIPRDDGIIDSIIGQEADFMRRLEQLDPPELDYAHESTIDLLARLHPGTDGRIVDFTDIDLHYLEVLLDAKAKARRYEKLADGAKAHLLEQLGEGAMGLLPDGQAVFRKRIRRKAFEVAETTYMQFTTGKAPKL